MDYQPIRPKCERDCEHECKEEGERCELCEKHPVVCCTPHNGCVDVEVKVFADIRKACDPCKKDEVVFCYKIKNNGPGCATNVVLKSFFCPAPRKVCVITREESARINYKNGILTLCFDRIKPCECIDVEVIIKETCETRCPEKFFEKCEEHKPEHHKDFEVFAFVEAKEEDLCVCNNVDFASTCHPRPPKTRDAENGIEI